MLPLDKVNEWADFWYDEIGVNIIPADTKKRRHMKIGYNGKTSQFLMNFMSNEKRMANIKKE